MDAVGGMAQDTRQLTNSVCLRLETCFPTLILSNFMNPRQSSLSDLDLVSKFDFFSSALAPHTHTRARAPCRASIVLVGAEGAGCTPRV